MFAFERLNAWQRCHQLTLAVYAATQNWPRNEQYGLVSQIRRAAISAEVNIAEGAAKRGPREFRRYLDISLGSLSELTCLLRIASDIGYLKGSEGESLEEARLNANRLTWRLYQAIEKRVSPAIR